MKRKSKPKTYASRVAASHKKFKAALKRARSAANARKAYRAHAAEHKRIVTAHLNEEKRAVERHIRKHF